MLEDFPESMNEHTEDTGLYSRVDPSIPLVITNNAMTPAPVTPRRPRKSATHTVPPTTPSDYYGTPTRSLRKNLAQLKVAQEDEDAAMPRRYRPTLLSYKQWHARDPRLEREWKLAEVAKDRRVKSFGHPFEHLRAAAVEAGFA